jgi:hypothetical protein
MDSVLADLKAASLEIDTVDYSVSSLAGTTDYGKVDS